MNEMPSFGAYIAIAMRIGSGPPVGTPFWGLWRFCRLVATLFRVWAETTFVLARICTQIMPGTEGTVCACRLIGGVHTSIHSGRASVRAARGDGIACVVAGRTRFILVGPHNPFGLA